MVVTICSAIFCYKVERKKRAVGARAELTPYLKVLICAVIAIVVITGLIALIAPTNNWDSMTYHMGRVAHWVQNGSIAHYPTNILRQLTMPPWAEFAVTHLQIMSGGDRFANLVQWFSMIGSVLGVSLIVRQLGGTLRAQTFSAVIAATIPMGIVQASNTQNDLAAAFWLVCFVYYGLKWRERPGFSYALGSGATLALAILTKGTAYIFALPFLLWFVFSLLKSVGVRALAQVVVLFLLVIVINSGHYIRNIELFGSPVHSAGLKFSNEHLGPATLISNISRNISIHLSTPSKRINNVTEAVVRAIHVPLSIDVSDPRTTWEDKRFSVRALSTHEDRSQNPLHFLLIAASIAIFLYSRRFRKPPELRYYLGMLIFSFALFCFYLKWQPWHSRLHLPLFLLFTPFVALTLGKVAHKNAANVVVALLILTALPWLFYNELRPVVARENIFNTTRIDQYFKYRAHLKEPYLHTTEAILARGCTDIGLKIGHEDWEYPFWILLNRPGEGAVRIEHVNVENISKIKALDEPFVSFKPCYLISW